MGLKVAKYAGASQTLWSKVVDWPTKLPKSFFGHGNGSPTATNVDLVVIRFSMY